MKITVKALKKLLENSDFRPGLRWRDPKERILALATLNGDNDSFQVLQDLWEEQHRRKETDKWILLQSVLDCARKEKIKVNQAPPGMQFDELPAETGCKDCYWSVRDMNMIASTRIITLLHKGGDPVSYGYAARIFGNGYTTVDNGNDNMFSIDPAGNVVLGDVYADENGSFITEEQADLAAERVKAGFVACDEYVDRFLDGVERGLGMKFR